MSRANVSAAHRSRLLAALLFLGGVGLAGYSVWARVATDPLDADDTAGDLSADPTTGALLIDFRDDATEAERESIASELRSLGMTGLGEEISHEEQLYRLTPAPYQLFAGLSALSDDVEGVDPNYELEGVEVEGLWAIPGGEAATLSSLTVPAAPAALDREPGRYVPDDPYYNHQWHLDQIGMPEAWGREDGAGVIVAVIDTGVAYRDGGGFMRAPDLVNTRFVEGWDFIDDDATPDDEHGHGTHCAGTIAQSTNNALGVAGVAPGVSIMPIRVLDRNGSGGWGGISAAIRWAADHGANVISMSLGGGMRSRTVERAIDYAYEHGVTIIAAAGNASRSTVEYPARHNHVIAVGSVRFDRDLAFYSSYGEGLDIVAPGGDLRVDQNGDGMPDGVLQNTIVGGNPSRFDYLAWQGTSMATPHAAGVAALVIASGVTDPDRVEQILESSATDLGDARRFGHGLISAPAALDAAGRGAAGARGLLGVGLAGVLLFALRRRNRLAIGIAAPALIAFAVAGGLGALPWEWVGLGFLGSALGGGLIGAAATAGPVGGLLAATAMVPVSLALVLAQVKRLVPLLSGLAMGIAAYLAVEALYPTLRFAILPEALVGPWLLANAALAAFVGRQLARKHG